MPFPTLRQIFQHDSESFWRKKGFYMKSSNESVPNGAAEIAVPLTIFEVSVSENWSMRKECPINKVPHTCCCYAVFEGSKCLYVGRTVDLYRRMYQHAIVCGGLAGICTFKSRDVHIFYVESDKRYLPHLEALLINSLHPSENRTVGIKWKAR